MDIFILGVTSASVIHPEPIAAGIIVRPGGSVSPSGRVRLQIYSVTLHRSGISVS
jgi:hypothetical protein